MKRRYSMADELMVRLEEAKDTTYITLPKTLVWGVINDLLRQSTGRGELLRSLRSSLPSAPSATLKTA